jgi:hypothetical protein
MARGYETVTDLPRKGKAALERRYQPLLVYLIHPSSFLTRISHNLEDEHGLRDRLLTPFGTHEHDQFVRSKANACSGECGQQHRVEYHRSRLHRQIPLVDV